MKDYLEFLFRHAGLNKAVLDNPDTPKERKKEILLAGMPWNYNKLNFPGVFSKHPNFSKKLLLF